MNPPRQPGPPGPPPHDWMHQENQTHFAQVEDRLKNIENRLETLLRALSVMVEAEDDLESEKSMESIVRFREQHRRLLFYDRQFSTLAQTIGTWVIRAMAAFVIASSIWAISNLEIVRQIWQSKH